MADIILLSLLCVYLLAGIVRLNGVRRHDRVLFRFCDIRRRLVRFIFERDRAGALGGGEYRAARRLLVALNRIIGDYDRRKAVMFDFRRFLRFLRAYEKDAVDLRPLAAPDSAELAALYDDAARALVMGFVAYTPFIRAEILLRIFAKQAARRLGRVRADAEKFGVAFRGGAIVQ